MRLYKMEYKDYYKILGVVKNASKDDIQRAYEKLARKHHPDVNTAPNAEDRFKEINEAKEVLKDPEKRKLYDLYGKDWEKTRQQPPPHWGNGRDLNDELITIRELGRLVGLHPDKLRRYIVLGLIDPEIEDPEPLFEDSIVARVHKIERLKKRPRAQP